MASLFTQNLCFVNVIETTFGVNEHKVWFCYNTLNRNVLKIQ